ncbi:hypothetical protein K488DRAFT_43880 [Vararia minispora EC-137]|uniref:Uncharacterized protein n=1 Tax=Vararia minispora EC-137 TaxID=1314806 RepID=A0ACB8QTR3_9AGAM|nr:hypothetical protein K488DRAFT_43880 [Vararia minispora EC-137]
MTTDPTALTTAWSVALLDEYTHALDTLPMDLSRLFADLRELDAVLSASVQQLIFKVEALVAALRDGTVGKTDRLWMLAEIADEAQRLKLGGEDKIRVACQAADGLRAHEEHMVALLTQLPGFDRTTLNRKTIYPHIAPRVYAPTNFYESGRRRRGALLTTSGGGETSGSNNKRKRNTRDDEEPAGGRTPRKERIANEGAPPRNKNPNRTRKADRAASPTESILSVTSHQQQFASTSGPAPRTNNRSGGNNKKRARPAAAGTPSEAAPTSVPPAAQHPSLPAPPFMPSAAVSWAGPAHPSLEGPGMPSSRSVAPEYDAEDADRGDGEDNKIYCFCNRPSFGDMVACDAEDCEREWFHLDCVGITSAPDGQWFCDECKSKQAKKPQPRNRNGKSRKSGGGRNGRGTAAAQS